MNIAGVIQKDILISFKRKFTVAEMLAGGTYDIIEMYALPISQAWEFISASVLTESLTIIYDGLPSIELKSDMRYQYTDNGAAGGGNNFLQMDRNGSAASDTYQASTKGTIDITAASTVGNGIITVYGTARIITL